MLPFHELTFLTPIPKNFPHIAVHPKGLSRGEGKVSCKLARGMARGCWETAQFTKAHWVNPQKEQYRIFCNNPLPLIGPFL